ncbi:MAG: hypothetical protein C4329_11590 [Chitinophagaceae bacterium]
METPGTPIQITILDDHGTFRDALSITFQQYSDCKVVLKAPNGKSFIEQLNKQPHIDLVFLDVNMPVIDGYETAVWLHEHRPDIHIVVVRMHNSPFMMMQMLKHGVKSFIGKGEDLAEVYKAVKYVWEHRLYYPNPIMRKLMVMQQSDNNEYTLTQQELQFLQLSCTQDTYKQMADKMGTKERSIDYIREQLFDRFGVQNRASLAIEAYRAGLATLDTHHVW